MIDINKVKTYSLNKRFSKVRAGDFAAPPRAKESFAEFFDSLPEILKAGDLRRIVAATALARKKKKAVIFMAGAHVIKCGLNPVLIELINRKVITCVCLNGAGIIHDFELALQAKTSEDVGTNLKNGKFGMGRETADFLNNAVKEGVGLGFGLGQAVASKIAHSSLKHKDLSLLNCCHRNRIPVCVFVAIGTDIIHQHPSFDGAACGQGSARDFYLLAEKIAGLNDGGVVLNFGSAVILPEVFLKALNLSRNLGNTVRGFTSANFDMIHQYRPAQNVVSRPVQPGGKGYYIIGHHELMLPLLAQAIIEKIS